MGDDAILPTIAPLIDAEHQLLRRSKEQSLTDAEHHRITGIDAALDQCWALLRQRRARRSAGLDPDRSQPRPASVVARHEQ